MEICQSSVSPNYHIYVNQKSKRRQNIHMGKNIGFVSTRLAGIDGVSLEASKWADVLESNGHRCYWFAGELDKDPKKSFLVAEAHFQHPHNNWINERVFGKIDRQPYVTREIHSLRSHLKAKLRKFIDNFNIDLLIIENALAIPLNIPLGIALTELISETQIPSLAHHHDFYWERINFLVNAAGEYLHMAFPPKLPNMEHVVINSLARDELARRRGILATIIPNVLDFKNSPCIKKNYDKEFRKSFGINNGDIIILQPTRIIKRKGIEHAIELVRALNEPHYKLIISHEAGDEGFKYAEWVKYHAREHGVDLRIANNRIPSPWNNNGNNSNAYSLWNVYAYADFITFPSLYEGFGNALIEAIYFKKPILINRYATFVKDIEPKGFDLVTIDGHLTKETVQRVREIIESSVRREKMVNCNYKIAKKHFSYTVLKERLEASIHKVFEKSDFSETSMETEHNPYNTCFSEESQFAQLSN
jgi:glycosyltransferase involved in cell wall biosynthesis